MTSRKEALYSINAPSLCLALPPPPTRLSHFSSPIVAGHPHLSLSTSAAFNYSVCVDKEEKRGCY